MCVAAAIGGSAVVGAVSSSKASKKAANAQQYAADQSIAEQRRQFDITQANQAPWMEAGRNALSQLSNPAANFQASPDYAFRQAQGMQGIERSAAARGGAFSGNALKALNEYNSNLASGEFGNWWNRQAGLAGVGQSATNTLASYGQNTANNVSNALMNKGEARASGVLGSANGITNALNTGLNGYLMYNGGMFGQGMDYGRAGGFGSAGYQGNSYRDIYG